MMDFSRYFIGMICGLCLLAGCSSPDAEQSKPAIEPVRLQLKWVHQAQFAGFYMAVENGCYEAENLSVTFIEGGSGIDQAKALISGAADFAVMAPEDILIRRGQGDAITALAAIYRRSATVLVAMADSGIIRPQDLIGKTVAAGGGDGGVRDFDLQFRAMMKKLDLDIGKVTLVDYDSQYNGFYSGAIDVTAAYMTGGVIRMLNKGYAVNLIWPGDYGINFYSDTLAATQETIALRTDMARRFVRATLKGWHMAIGDPQAAVRVTMKYARLTDENLQLAMMEALLPLVHTGEDSIGWMKKQDWRRMHRILIEQNILPRPITDLDSVYTLDFLENEKAAP